MDNISPLEAFNGRKPNYKIDIKGISFGDYVQAENPNIQKNGMEPRTLGAIALYPVGNIQGSYFFYVMATGKVVSRDRWELLPIPAEVISHMNKLASNYYQRSCVQSR